MHLIVDVESSSPQMDAAGGEERSSGRGGSYTLRHYWRQCSKDHIDQPARNIRSAVDRRRRRSIENAVLRCRHVDGAIEPAIDGDIGVNECFAPAK